MIDTGIIKPAIFLSTFFIGVVFTWLILAYLFSNRIITVNDTPEYVVEFVCGDDPFCRGEKCRH